MIMSVEPRSHFNLSRPMLSLPEVQAILAERGIKISRQRIWQIEERALRKLRERLAEFYADWEGKA